MFIVALAVVSMACHGRGDPRHNLSVHSAVDDEEFCVESTSSVVSASDLNGYLIEVLLLDDVGEGWNLLLGGKIWFQPLGDAANCESEDTWTLYVVKDSTPECGGLNCVYHEGDPDCIIPAGETECNHDHYAVQTVYLNSGNIVNEDDLSKHTVNHETGHVLGLLDPIDPIAGGDCIGCGVISDETCDYCSCLFHDHLNQVRWVDSIMHSRYYCAAETARVQAGPEPSDRVKPTAADRRYLEAIILDLSHNH